MLDHCPLFLSFVNEHIYQTTSLPLTAVYDINMHHPYSPADFASSFSCLQHDFLSAVSEGVHATTSFASRISDLQEQATHVALNHKSPSNNSLLDMAHKASLGIAALAKSFIGVEEQADCISTSLELEITTILDGLSLDGM